MISATHQPLLLAFDDDRSWNTTLDLLAVGSEDGQTVVLRVVNVLNATVPAVLALSGYNCSAADPSARRATVMAVEMWGADLDAVNPPATPAAIAPKVRATAPARAFYHLPFATCLCSPRRGPFSICC